MVLSVSEGTQNIFDFLGFFSAGPPSSTLRMESYCIEQPRCCAELSSDGWFRRIKCLLAEVPDKLPSSALKVSLHTNKITSITPGKFRLLTNCTSLSLANNWIAIVEKETFKGMVSLKLLVLSRNQISQIDTGAFLGLDSVQKLILNINLLSVLKYGMFSGLKRVF